MGICGLRDLAGGQTATTIREEGVIAVNRGQSSSRDIALVELRHGAASADDMHEGNVTKSNQVMEALRNARTADSDVVGCCQGQDMHRA